MNYLLTKAKHTAVLTALSIINFVGPNKLHAQVELNLQTDRKVNVLGLRMSADGKYIASAQNNAWATLWYADTGRAARMLGFHRGNVAAVDFSPDGKYVATGSWDSGVRVFQAEGGRREANSVAHAGAVLSLRYNKQGTLLAAGATDGRISIHDTHRLRLERWIVGHTNWVTALDFHPTKNYELASVSSDGRLMLWNPDNAGAIMVRNHEKGLIGVAYSDDGNYLAVGTGVGDYIVYHSHDLSEVIRIPNIVQASNNMDFQFGGQIYKVNKNGSESFMWRPFINTVDAWDVISSVPGLAGLLQERSQFETGLEYLKRSMKGANIAGPLVAQRTAENQERIRNRIAVSRKPVVLSADDLQLLDYDIYESIYEIIIKGARHSIAINREEARSLYENRQHVRIEAVEQLSKNLHDTEIFNIQLVHPTSGIRYFVGQQVAIESLPSLATLPARIEVLRADFTDSDGDNRLAGGERATLLIELKNSGEGPAQFVRVVGSTEADISGLSANLGTIEAGTTTTVTLTLLGGDKLKEGNAEITLSTLERNGFHADPFKLIIPTRPKAAPKLALVDVGVEDAQGRSVITPGIVMDVTLRLRNAGEGHAEGVRAVVRPGEGVFLAGGNNPMQASLDVGALAPGTFRDVRFQAFANNEAQGFPLSVQLTEASGRHDLRLDDLGLELMRPQRSIRELTIAARDLEAISNTDVALGIDIASNIPKATEELPDAVAVVIGNRSYQAGVPQVAFALNDAVLMRRYLEEALGYRPGNILHIEDATLTNMRVLFGDANNPRGRLRDLVKPGLSDVFVYYSGHGAPDPNAAQAYLMPIDADPMRLALTGYSLEVLYENLSKLEARSITVVLDACFSGATGGGDMLIAAASPIGIRVNDPSALLGEQAVVIAAANNQQVASWYPEMRHGLFTYFFLKGLQGAADLSGNGHITAAEMAEYLRNDTEGVPYMARRLYSREQQPQVWGNLQFQFR